MFHTQDPRKTILFYIEDSQQLAVVKVSPEGRLSMEEITDPIEFVNKVIQGDNGDCLKKDYVKGDFTITYITVTKRTWKLKDQPLNEQHVIKISKGLYSQSYCF